MIHRCDGWRGEKPDPCPGRGGDTGQPCSTRCFQANGGILHSQALQQQPLRCKASLYPAGEGLPRSHHPM